MQKQTETGYRADAGTANLTPAEIDSLMSQVFGSGRGPRSEPYRQGVRSILAYRLAGAPLPKLPYDLGTAEADAYFAGQGEGRQIAPVKSDGAA